MKKWKTGMAGALVAGILAWPSFTPHSREPGLPHTLAVCKDQQACIFRTLMGEEFFDSAFMYKTPEAVLRAADQALAWIGNAQQGDGGFGAGSHYHQEVLDPHAVPSDPATTSMVAMALLRNGATLTSGKYHVALSGALNYLLIAVEQAPAESLTITNLTGTQIQVKLGQNIDVVLTAQFLSNMLDHLDRESELKRRVTQDLALCVAKIQRAQNTDGTTQGSGWAGVLQSSFATNALEAAQDRGIKVDKDALNRAKQYQKGNYDPKTGVVNTDLGAGVMLYSVSGSTRASAKEARQARESIDDARRDGRLPSSAPVSAENLKKIGYSESEAMNYATAYGVYESAKVRAQDADVMNGFGSNGGEEFLSYLQTGESMIIGKDNSWTKWYDNTSGRLLNIQNEDGSWSGHHCITSPVFCTATCLLILAVNNDIDKLVGLGANGKPQ